jgi:nitrogen regulatory protein P-II 1
LKIVVAEEDLDQAIDAVQQSASTGKISDGKIFVLPIDEPVRIRTGAKGPAAI